MKDEIYIVYASDDNFAEVLGVSMMSLFDTNEGLDIVIYILDSGISALNKSRLEEVCNNYNRLAPIWLQAKNINDILGMQVQIDRGSLSQYARLFISSLLPEKVDKILYLDCDILINGSIEPLWKIGGKTIAALMDAFSKQYRANIELQPNDIMFNSGVMLIDLKKWRENKIEEKLLVFIKRRKGNIQQGDQGALNAILTHDMICIEPRFNSVTIFHDFTYEEMMIYRKPLNFYSDAEVRKAIEEPVLIHFTTSYFSRRPWIVGCHHRYKDLWLKYKQMSPWKDVPLKEYNVSKCKKIILKIFNILPRKLAIYVAGFFQAYGRPMYYRIFFRR